MRRDYRHSFCLFFLILLIPFFCFGRKPFTQYGILPAVLQNKNVVKMHERLGVFRSIAFVSDEKKTSQKKQYYARLTTDHCDLSGELKIGTKCPFGSWVPILGDLLFAPAGACHDQIRYKLKNKSCAKAKSDTDDEKIQEWENSMKPLAFAWENVIRGSSLSERGILLNLPAFNDLVETPKTLCQEAKVCNLRYGFVKRIDHEANRYVFTFSSCELSAFGSRSLKTTTPKKGDCVIRTEVITDENMKQQYNLQGYVMRVLGIRFVE
jgi:hypothetical protein